MLIEFSVGNYKSFKEPVTLSMVAAKRLASRDRTLDANTVFPVDDDLSLLTSAAVYGANASGKSNLVDAMKFMRNFVWSSSKDTQAGERIPVEPFALDPAMRTRPTSFEMVFIAEGTQYRYGFEIDASKVIREWLYHIPKRKEELLFERNASGITVTKNFSEGSGLEERTRDNALFLSVVAQFNGRIARLITMWFFAFDTIAGVEDPMLKEFTAFCINNAVNENEILNFVQSLDIGIINLRVEGGGCLGENGEIKTVHRTYTASGEPMPSIEFDLETQESEGTKKIIALAGMILSILQQHGHPLIIDEFDARLHPLLTREIVRMFNNSETNPHHAQLVFMTHDTNLLDRTLLRRDQIWFVEKDRFGASHLYSLAEMKVRNDASYERDYVEGKYGAIPFLGDLRRVVEDASA
ncbi:MAG: AAA family ATPase [Armatimonadota bacterium]